MFSIEKFIAGLIKVLRNVRIEEKDTYFAIIKYYKSSEDEGTEEIEAEKIEKGGLQECMRWHSDKTIFMGVVGLVVGLMRLP